jgi:prepilin-type N-terminal cleavage/methylation domain-containing protein
MKKGFTLIEFLIYISILASILVLMVGFFWNIIFGNIKETSYQEVQQNGRFALTKMFQEIRKATKINAPSPGSSANFLSLAMTDPDLNPTVFRLKDGKLTISQGGNPAIELTTDRVIVANLLFTNLSYEDTPGTIRIEIEISYLNPSGRSEYEASINLKSTVSLLPGGASS